MIARAAAPFFHPPQSKLDRDLLLGVHVWREFAFEFVASGGFVRSFRSGFPKIAPELVRFSCHRRVLRLASGFVHGCSGSGYHL